MISENMPGQFRGWFNALFWAGVTLTGKAPFKSLFGYETLKDEKGEEMHKSKGNAIWFNDAVEKVGADPIRLLYSLQDPSQELKFGFNALREPTNNLNVLSNIRRLIENENKVKITKIEDRWIFTKLNNLIKKVTSELENLHPHLATRALKDFWLNNFSRTYIKFVRERLSNEDKEAMYTLKEVYITLIKILAPIIPFSTENIWQDLKERKIIKEESVHLSSWPKSDSKKIDNRLEKDFDNILKVIEVGLAKRDKIQIGLKWPLPKATITSDKFDRDLQEIIKIQLNVKSLEFKKGEEIVVKLDTNLTPELEAEGYAREVIRKIQAFRKNLGLEKKNKVEVSIFTDEEFKKVLDIQKDSIKSKVNAKTLEIVTTSKERFKNKTDFKVKERKGVIGIIY